MMENYTTDGIIFGDKVGKSSTVDFQEVRQFPLFKFKNLIRILS